MICSLRFKKGAVILKMSYSRKKWIEGLEEIPHDSFLITPGNSTLLLIKPWKFHLVFLRNPWIFHILNTPPPPFCFLSSGIAQCSLYFVLFVLLEAIPNPSCYLSFITKCAFIFLSQINKISLTVNKFN